jgi:hypothetical protein
LAFVPASAATAPLVSSFEEVAAEGLFPSVVGVFRTDDDVDVASDGDGRALAALFRTDRWCADDALVDAGLGSTTDEYSRHKKATTNSAPFQAVDREQTLCWMKQGDPEPDAPPPPPPPPPPLAR